MHRHCSLRCHANDKPLSFFLLLLLFLSRPHYPPTTTTNNNDDNNVQAWSSIVVSLIPNVSALKMHLQSFASIMDADEVVLFERATFLVISHTCEDSVRARDPHRFEKISNIIKQFKLSCSKTAAQFQSMEVRNENFAAYIDYFTTNTYVMVIMADASIPSAATLLNIHNARKHFERLEGVQ